MRQLLLLLFAAYASATGLDDCTWGPSHWCSDLSIAKRCGAVEHCIQTVWTHDLSYMQDNGDICQFCENFLGDVKNLAANKTITSQIRNYLDAACNIIPVSALADQCKEQVDNNMDEIIDMLSKMDTKAVCAAIGLCSGFKDRIEHDVKASQDLHHIKLSRTDSNQLNVNLDETKVSGDICTDCKTFIGDIQAQVTDKTTQAQVEQLLKNELCSQLGAMKDECDDLVDMYVPQLLQLLSEQVDPNMVCGAMGFCSGDKTILIKMKLKTTPLYKALTQKLDANEECVFCKAIFEGLQDLDQNKASQDAVLKFVENEVCSKLGDMKNECTQTIDQYGPVLFDLLASELDPATRCSSLGFCTAKTLVTSNILRLNMPLKQDSQKPKEKVKHVAGKVSASAECILCEYIMSEVDGLIQENSTQKEIEAALDKVCSLLPDTIGLQCRDFIDTYAPAILDLLSESLAPEQICTSLGLCASKQRMMKPLVAAKSIHKLGDQACDVCEIVVQYVDSLIKENSTEKEIVALLDKVCNYLPSSLTQQCTTFVNEYGPMIAELVANDLSPAEVCQEIGVCPKAVEEQAVVPVKEQLLGQNECTYGPAFWCTNMENAKKCNAVPHCQKHVWIN